jgi:hypothetical protein
MGTVAAVLYWVDVILLVLTVVLAIFAAVRISGRRVFTPWRCVLQVVLTVLVFAGLVLIAGASFSWLWAVVLLVLGGVAGFFAERAPSRFSVTGGKVAVRRSPLAPWIVAVASVLLAMTLLFGTSYLFALAMLVFAFALGTAIGQLAAEFVGARAATA